MSFFDRIKETVSDKKLDFETLFSPKKTRIVSILGMKGAGKTTLWRPLQNKEVEGRGVLGIKGASERGGSKE